MTKPAVIVCEDGTELRNRGNRPSESVRVTLRMLQERNEAMAALSFQKALEKLTALVDSEDVDISLKASIELARMGMPKKKAPATKPEKKTEQSEDVDLNQLEAQAGGLEEDDDSNH